MNLLRSFLVSLMACYWLAVTVLAQSTGTVQGHVKDPSGGVVAGAAVTLTSKDVLYSVPRAFHEASGHTVFMRATR
jgi:hypothetical protein